MFKETPLTLGINPDKTKVENANKEAAQELKNLQDHYERKADFLKWLWSLRESSEKIQGLLNTPESKTARDQFLDYQNEEEIKVTEWLREHNLKTIKVPNPKYGTNLYEWPDTTSVDRAA